MQRVFKISKKNELNIISEVFEESELNTPMETTE